MVVMLFLILLLRAQTIVAEDSKCVSAWEAFSTDCQDVCDAGDCGCTNECEELKNQILEDCADGDFYEAGDRNRLQKFSPAVAYYTFKDYSTCDFGYTESDCELSYSAWDDSWWSCQACTESCQAVANDVLSTCKKGDTFHGELTSVLENTYMTFQLWTDYKGFSTCDLGYTANACDIALFAYYKQGALEESIYSEGKGLCSPEQNSPDCSEACSVLVDAVVESCSGGSFVPTCCFGDETNEKVYWDPNADRFRNVYMPDCNFASVCTDKFLKVTAEPSATPSAAPSAVPSVTSTAVPTETSAPSAAPSAVPSVTPTAVPTETSVPSAAPSVTAAPSAASTPTVTAARSTAITPSAITAPPAITPSAITAPPATSTPSATTGVVVAAGANVSESKGSKISALCLAIVTAPMLLLLMHLC